MYSNEENTLIAQIALIEGRIKAMEQERSELLARLSLIRQARDEGARKSVQEAHPSYGKTASESAIQKEAALMRRLFRGREDVFAVRWESIKTGRSGYQPACGNEWEPDLCDNKKVKCSKCAHRSLLPLTDGAIRRHLTGIGCDGSSKKSYNPYFCIGIYPLLTDETCWFLAVDFDKDTWQEDIGAFRETCRSVGILAHGERSRSGRACMDILRRSASRFHGTGPGIIPPYKNDGAAPGYWL